MARFLVRGPSSTPQDRQAAQAVEATLARLGHDARSSAASDLPGLRAELERCDAAVILLDGSPPDGVAFLLLGLAHGVRRHALALRSDARPLGTDLRLFVDAAGASLAAIASWEPAAVEAALAPFLSRVRVLAGTLVRDAVPEILQKEGRPLRFRSVEPAAYPQVLKRKLVETAQRLEETDFGLEQEEIADLLEVLETLINLRAYDRESLRSIKEGKWRRRGGYERGLLLEEEPKVG